MVFSSTIFLFIFLPLVLLSYYLLDRPFKNILLLLASLFFYAWGEPKFVFVMIGSLLVNYLSAFLIDYFKKSSSNKTVKVVLAITVLLNLSLFFVFKYLNFTIRNINAVSQFFGSTMQLPETHIVLPIGISFFTFQAMSYVFDVYYGYGEVQKNPLNVILYVSLFPQLIAGPIVRYQTVANEIKTRQETLSDFSKGIERFIIGLAKKVIIANTVAVAADAAYAALSNNTLTVGLSWIGAIAYSLQIYFDFSGYSDMAIGLGLMFGFHFLENFDHPYMSKTISEFWRRWHISLGTWFRDYVYFPLGGSRVKSKSRLVFNLFVVWMLTGIWHGANWTFVLWGFMYFAVIATEKITGLERKLEKHKALSILYRVFSLLIVLVGWVIFRATNLSSGVAYLGAMFGNAPGGIWSNMTHFMLKEFAVILGIAIICCFDWKRILSSFHKQLSESKPNLVFILRFALLAVLATASISFNVISTYNPFIYFNF